MLSEQFFISDKLEEREVELADGSKHVLWFKHLPNTAFERHAIWVNSLDEEVQSKAMPRLLAMGLCDPDGKPAITAEQAEKLKRPVLVAMVRALFDVNGFGQKAARAGKASAPGAMNGSGM